MDNYLLLIGSNIEQIRQILNWTQEDLAKKLGISRPTIVKLEQNPSRFTKTLALALFMVVSYEISIRIKNLSNINPLDYKRPEDFSKFITATSSSTYLPGAAFASAALVSIGGVIPGVGAIIAGLTMYKFLKNPKNKPKEFSESLISQIKEENWNEQQGQKLIDELKKVLNRERNKLLNCFDLDSFSVEEFMKKLENNVTV